MYVDVNRINPNVDIASNTTSVLPDPRSKLRRQLREAGEHKLNGTGLGHGSVGFSITLSSLCILAATTGSERFSMTESG